jgi:lauroyl/myristoyl acyltransferase
MHFRAIKDLIAQPLHWIAGLPEGAVRTTVAGVGALARAAYFVPGTQLRRKVQDFCCSSGRSDPWPVYSGMVRNLQEAAVHYSLLNRFGRAELLARTIIDPTLDCQYARLGKRDGGLIFLVPHCAAAVLSSARLSTFCPTVLLVREPRSPARQRLMLEYLQKLGPEVILTRNASPAKVMRDIMRALRERKVIVGTTDVIHPGPDTVQTLAFGERVFSPSWPARIAARLGVPIVSGFIHMEGRQIRLMADEGYYESDIDKSTQRWLSNFEAWFRKYPSDWVFLLDKRWARVFAVARNDVPPHPAEALEFGPGPVKTGETG